MSFKLICTGDLMLGENVHHYRRGIATRFKSNYPSLVSDEVRNLLSGADILLMNFESSLACETELQQMKIERAAYVASLQSLTLLKSLKTNIILNIANNHSGQHGRQSALDGIQHLEANGFIVIGKDKQSVDITFAGKKIRFFGVSLVEDKFYDGAYFKSSYENLLHDLQLTDKKENEIRIISIHWGEEYYTLENSRQKRLAQELTAAGFDFIHGHHPHVIQPYQKINGNTVFYSHGNFIFDQNFSHLTQKGLISVSDIPGGVTDLYISRQKHFRVTALNKVAPEELTGFCNTNYSRNKPLQMRIRMKLELIFRFYELNLPIVRTFIHRLFKKSGT